MVDRPFICSDIESCRQATQAARWEHRVGLVPTMGALHEGHFSLVKQSLRECDFTIVSIFVNPTQFAPHEDLSAYPRPLEQDCAALTDLGVDMIFTPNVEVMYPSGFATVVQLSNVTTVLEGAHRPEHFAGVTTVVTKLFNITPAHVAFFGQKDYQQTVVIRQLVRDLNIPIEIRLGPTVREPDGLALSSRNQYLNKDERGRAVALSQCLTVAQQCYAEGCSDPVEMTRQMTEHLMGRGVTDVDYVALADPDTLAPVDQVEVGTVALVAARVGSTRLIDNKRIE